MACPQPDIFIRISKEFFEALCRFGVPRQERQVFDAVLFETWGHYPCQKEATITNARFRELTGLQNFRVSRAVASLVEKNIIEKKGERGEAVYSVQKDYERWRIAKIGNSNENELPKKTIGVAKIGNSIAKIGNSIAKIGNSTEPTPIYIKDIDKNTEDTPIPPSGEERAENEKTDFEVWYSEYPRKKKPKDAKKAWDVLAKKKDFPPLCQLLEKLELQKQSRDWTKNGGQFIPYPATYLRAGDYLSETETTKGIDINGKQDYSDACGFER